MVILRTPERSGRVVSFSRAQMSANQIEAVRNAGSEEKKEQSSAKKMLVGTGHTAKSLPAR